MFEIKIVTKCIIVVVTLIIAAITSIYMSTAVYLILEKQEKSITLQPLNVCINNIRTQPNVRSIATIIVAIFCVLIYLVFFMDSSDNYHSETYKVTPSIRIPVRAGQNQHGSSWFMDDDDFNELFPVNKLSHKSDVYNYLIATGYDDLPKKLQPIHKAKHKNYDNIDFEPFSNVGGGVVIEYRKGKYADKIHTLVDDIHTLVIGSTRCGKTRCLVIQTILTIVLAGESTFISDVKGELYQYTYPILKRLGVNVIVINFRNMAKSMSYNYLQPIIDEIKAGNENDAFQMCRDLGNTLAGKRSEQTESMWHDGKIAVIAASICACIYDNMNHPERQNLSYVYDWMTRMCADIPGKKMLLQQYLDIVGENHPANRILAQANVAPSKTRGSFYTSAATALTLFTDVKLYHICNHSDFKLTDITTKKTAMFVIMPDSKTTFYPLATLLVAQLYDALDNYCTQTLGTGRLPRRVHFVLDEFGNFSPFANIESMLTVGAGKGMIFDLILQDYAQIKEKYSDNIMEIISGNCTNQIYLKSTNSKTRKEISEDLDTYTTSVYSKSSNSGKNSYGGSNSMNLSERKLLLPGELKRIKRPYMLLHGGENDARIAYCPDLAKWSYNKMLGLGNKPHNEKVRAYRENAIEEITDVSKPIAYTGIWTDLRAFALEYKHKH